MRGALYLVLYMVGPPLRRVRPVPVQDLGTISVLCLIFSVLLEGISPGEIHYHLYTHDVPFVGPDASPTRG
jgi:hypothetical protein